MNPDRAGLGRRALYDHGCVEQRLDRRTAPLQYEEERRRINCSGSDRTAPHLQLEGILYHEDRFPGLLRNNTEWSERYRLPLAFGAQGAALMFNGRFERLSRTSKTCAALGPRDPFVRSGSTVWRSRTSATAATSWQWVEPNCGQYHPHAGVAADPRRRAARLGQRQAAQEAFDEHMRRHRFCGRPGHATDPCTASDDPQAAALPVDASCTSGDARLAMLTTQSSCCAPRFACVMRSL